MAPRPRMPTFGWLITGNPNSPPNTPGFVIEKRSFLHLFRLQLFSNARALRQIVHRPLNAENILFVGALYHGHDQAPIERHGDADVYFLVPYDVLCRPARH